MGEDDPVIDKLVVDDYIAGQLSVDSSITRPEPYVFKGYREFGEEHEKVEKYRVLNPKTIFTIIFFTSIATLVVNPQWLVFTLPISIALSILASLISRREREEDLDESRRVRGDEEWW